MKLLRKLTIRKAAPSRDADAVAKGGRAGKFPVMAVIGVVTGYSQMNSDMGPYLKFRGQFRAVDLNASGGEEKEFAAPAAIFPGIIADQLQADCDVANGEPVKFGGVIGAEPDTGNVGWKYYFEPQVETRRADLLADMGGVLAKHLPNATAATAIADANKGKGKSK